MDALRFALGMGGRQSVLRALRLSDHIASCLSRARKPRYFRNFYARGRCASGPFTCWSVDRDYANAPWFVGAPVLDCSENSAMADLSSLSAEPASSRVAARSRADLVARNRGAILLSVGAAGAVSGQALDAGGTALCCALVGSPLMRRAHFHWLTPTHTLMHLDGIAMGSLLALGALHGSACRHGFGCCWGLLASCAELLRPRRSPAEPHFSIQPWQLALGGPCLLRLRRPARAIRLSAALRRGPLAFYGRISYGLYMIHIMVFIYFGWFDLRMDAYGMRREPRRRCIPAGLPQPRRRPFSGMALSRRF